MLDSAPGWTTDANTPSRIGRTRESSPPFSLGQPVVGSLLVFFAVTLGLGLWTWRVCNGVWTYAFDDAYIHLAISHNLAYAGVWGVSPTSFASASSSPLWTVVLAAALRLYNSDLVPLVLNIIFGAAILVVANRAWDGSWSFERFSPRAKTVGLLILCLVAPLPLLALIGMEHCLHLLIALGFLYLASRSLGESKSARLLPLLALLMGGIRFEGVFLAMCTAWALARQKRYLAAGATAAASLVPFVLHGLMAHSQGWPFVATSVAIKRDVIELTLPGLFTWLQLVLLKAAYAWPLTLMVVLAWLSAKRVSSPALRVALRLYAPATLLHVALSLCTGFYRYEGYLFGLGVVLLWPTVIEIWPRERTRAALGVHIVALMVGCGCILRAATALPLLPLASRNIYLQQRQMANFVTRFYGNEEVVLNDIGTTAWASVNHPGGRAPFDLVGLSQLDIAQMRIKHAHRWSLVETHDLIQSRHLRLAIIYDHWFPDHILPSDWIEVAQWDSGPHIVSGGDQVSFWTPRAHAAQLRAQLQAFQRELAPGVTTTWN